MKLVAQGQGRGGNHEFLRHVEILDRFPRAVVTNDYKLLTTRGTLFFLEASGLKSRPPLEAVGENLSPAPSISGGCRSPWATTPHLWLCDHTASSSQVWVRSSAASLEQKH